MVGELVGLAESQGIRLSEITDEDAKQISEFLTNDWREVFDLKRAFSMREKPDARSETDSFKNCSLEFYFIRLTETGNRGTNTIFALNSNFFYSICSEQIVDNG